MRRFLPILSPQEQVLDQHRDRLLRYVTSIVRNPSDAEDLLREILLRAHRGVASLRAGEVVMTWRLRIATQGLAP